MFQQGYVYDVGMGPKTRFAVTMSFLITLFWAWGIANDYLFGEAGLNVSLFIHGVIQVGSATLFGFALVAAGVFFVTNRRKTKSAFEANVVDEYGTTFNWPIMLSKFVPEIIAAPQNENLTPLEQELIGFLNGYRTWPYNIKQPPSPQNSLGAVSMRRWHKVRGLHNATELHRIVALALDFTKVVSYTEKRTIYPWWKLWRQDKISYAEKAAEHGSFGAFILSTFESFRALDADTREILLLAIRFCRDPQRIPVNAPPIVKEICRTVIQADTALKTADNPENTKDAALTMLATEAKTYAQGIIAQLRYANNNDAHTADGVYLGGKEAITIVKLNAFVAMLSEYLPPDVREVLYLWEIDRVDADVQRVVVTALTELDFLRTTWEEETAQEGVFSLSFGGQMWSQALVLGCTPDKAPLVFKAANALPSVGVLPEPAVDDAALLADIQAKALSIDGLLNPS